MSILLNEDFTFIVQGITGREAVNLTRECLDFGSSIVGGVTPGRKGREVHGVPVFDTVEQAVEHHGKPIDGAVATDTWGHHAGVVAVGFRQPLPRNLSVELWGGLMLGPRSVRRVAQEVPDERRLTTFQVGLDLAWDVWR